MRFIQKLPKVAIVMIREHNFPLFEQYKTKKFTWLTATFYGYLS